VDEHDDDIESLLEGTVAQDYEEPD